MAEADISIWTPEVEHRDHPFGEAGVVSSLENVAERVKKGGLSPRVRIWAIECLDRARKTRGLKADNDRERAEILLRAVQEKLWVPDPVGAEWMAGAHLMACDPTKDGVCFRGGDCFPSGTLMLAEGHELVPVEHLRTGMRIWGLDRWSEVEAVKYKGYLPVDIITLNNGSEVKLTGDHHVYVLDCQEHPMLDDEKDARVLPEDRHWRGGGTEKTRWGCSCKTGHRVEKRCRVSELREGMVVPTPERIPFGTKTMDPDRAYVEGLYVSDGWADYHKNNHFSIRGQDGCPKEEQKREVQEACERLSINTSWKRKSISVRDKEWTLRIQQMGRYAPEKHLLSINLDEAAAAPTLRGVMADSGANTRGPSRTFTTTSRELAIQTRLLHKMFGVQCGWRYIENHGGLGKNPIYRLGQRGREREDSRSPWALKVKRIERNVLHVPCWDIQTDDHRVYLPEHDVTVSQCDDLVVLLGSCFCSVGLYTLVVGHAYNRDKDISHVLTAVRVGGRWMYADPSTSLPLGECVDFTRERLYSVPNIKVLCDANACLVNPRKYDPESSGFVTKGDFIGVNGPPEFAWVSPPNRTVQWLGATPVEQGTEAGEQAASREIQNTQWPPDESDVERVIRAAAITGATATCAALGAGPASPLCGLAANVWVSVGKKVVEKIGSVFKRNDAARKAKEEALRTETFFSTQNMVQAIVVYQMESIKKIIEELTSAYQTIWGTAPSMDHLDWMIALGLVGAPVRQTSQKATWTDQPERLNVVPNIDPMARFNSEVDRHWSKAQQVQWLLQLQQDVHADLSETERAALLLVAGWVADKGAQEVVAGEARGVSKEGGATTSTKKSSSVGWIALTAAAAGLAWWLL